MSPLACGPSQHTTAGDGTSSQARMLLTEPNDCLEDRPTKYTIRGLRYFLIEGGTSWLESLRIIGLKQLLWADRDVILYALGASHAVSVRHREKQVTELLSCSGHFRADQYLAEMAASHPFEISTTIHGMSYRFRLTLHTLQGNDALLGRYPHEDEITVAYPPQPEFATPVTRIGWHIEPGVLRLETLHTYPEEQSGVRTESIIEIP